MRFGRFSMLALALAAGAVDALSFLALGQVFTANMTGNVVLLGLALGTGDTSHVIRSGLALTTFCLGLAIGFTLLGRAAPAGRAPRPRGPPHHPPARRRRRGTGNRRRGRTGNPRKCGPGSLRRGQWRCRSGRRWGCPCVR
ncbi:YoaK family protein [Actinomadura sp. ATCC 39365]